MFKNSVTYDKLHDKYGENLSKILKPFTHYCKTSENPLYAVDSTVINSMFQALGENNFYSVVPRIWKNNVQLRISSTSDLDKPGESGVSKISIRGYNGDISPANLKEEIVTLNGTSTVVTRSYYSLVLGAKIIESGDISFSGNNNSATGEILIRGVSGYVMSIATRDSEARPSYYMVPKGCTVYINKIRISTTSLAKGVTGHLSWSMYKSVKPAGKGPATTQEVFGGQVITEEDSIYTFDEPLEFSEGTIIEFTIKRASTKLVAKLFAEGYELYGEHSLDFKRLYNKEEEVYQGESLQHRVYGKHANSIKYTKKGLKYRKMLQRRKGEDAPRKDYNKDRLNPGE